jgi:hypothetical protein
MSRLIFAAALLALPLAACGAHDDKDGTTIQFNASDADGNVTGSMDASGKIAIDAPGFSGSLKLPKLHLDANDFDMNGVHLYPGSSVTGMNINAHDKGNGGDDDGAVTVSFASPASPDAVQSWFLDRLNKANFSVKTDGTGLSGFTDDKKPFRLDLSPDGAGKATGVITIG